MECHIIPPDLDRRLGEQRRQRREGGFFFDNDAPLLRVRNAAFIQEYGPGKLWRKCLELRDTHRVVDFIGVAPLGARPMKLGDLGFEIEDVGGLLLGIGNPAELEHVRNVAAIGVARRDDAPLILEVIVAVRQPQSRFPDENSVGVGILSSTLIRESKMPAAPSLTEPIARATSSGVLRAAMVCKSFSAGFSPSRSMRWVST